MTLIPSNFRPDIRPIGASGTFLRSRPASTGYGMSWATANASDVGLGSVENTALSTWKGSQNLATLGTVVTGIWNATKISTLYGGTNLTGIGTSQEFLTVSTDGTSLQYRTYNWGDGLIDSEDELTGDFTISVNTTLLNATTHTDTITTGVGRGQIIIGNSTPKWSTLSIGSSGTFIKSNGLDPSWQSLISSDVGLGNVENTALSTWVGSQNLKTLGIIATGTWSGDVISIAKGGTALSTSGTSNQVLGINSAGTSLEYKTISAGSGIGITHAANSITIYETGRLLDGVAHSDTSLYIPVRGSLILANSTPKWSGFAIGTSGQVIRSNGNDPVYVTLAANDIGLGNVENTALSTWVGSTNLKTLGTIVTGVWNGTVITSGYLQSDIVYQNAVQNVSGIKTFADLSLVLRNNTNTSGTTINAPSGSTNGIISFPDKTGWVILNTSDQIKYQDTYNRRQFSVNANYGANTRSVYGIAAPTANGTASSVVDASGAWNVFTSSAATSSNGSLQGATAYRRDQGAEITMKVRPSGVTTVSHTYGFGTLREDAGDNTDSAVISYNTTLDGTAFWRCMVCNADTTASVFTTNVAVVNNVPKIMSVRLLPTSVEFRIDDILVYTATGSLPTISTAMPWVISAVSLNNNAVVTEFAWVNGSTI